MKYLYLLLVTACVVPSYSQTLQSTRILERYYETRDSIRRATPEFEYLRRHADAFARVEHLKACSALGIDPSDPVFSGSVDMDQLPQWADTSLRKNISNSSTDQEETTIAINRTNKKNIIAGANDGGMYNSGMPSYNTTNGGVTWVTSRISMSGTGYVAIGDPMTIADDKGNFYYAFLAINQGGASNLFVARSKNGKQWTVGKPVVQPQTVLFFEDKEHIAVDTDPESPYYGRLYIVWMRFSNTGGEGSGIMSSYSDNQGVTWSEPVNIYPGSGQFSQVRVGPGGIVYLSFSTGIGADIGNHVFYRSLDGGDTYDGVSLVSEFYSYPYNSDGRPSVKGDDGFRVYPVTAFDVDRSSGRIHFVYCSWNNFAGSIYYVFSDDRGETWSQPLLVGTNHPDNPVVERDRFMPWVTVDQQNRIPYVFYYSSEDDPDNIMTSVFRLVLDEKGDEIPRRIGGASFDPMLLTNNGNNALPFLGDYIGCDAFDSVFAAAWTENRPNRTVGDVFAAVMTPVYRDTSGTSGIPTKILIASKKLTIGSLYPNPVTAEKLTIQFALPYRSEIRVSIVNEVGVTIKQVTLGSFDQGSYHETIILPDLPKGAYIARIESVSETASMLFVIH